MNNGNLYRKALGALDWGSDALPVVVVGHRNPDGDSVMAAMAYANLMMHLGYNAVAKMAGKANNETVFAAKSFGFELPGVVSAVSVADRLILVDHSDYAQAVDGARDARILQVIDHHGIGDITESKLLYAKYMPVGSCCSIVYTSYKELDVDVTAEIAKILLAGLLSDTLNLQKVTVTDVDRAVFDDLLGILANAWNVDVFTASLKVSGIYEGMVEAAHDFSAMSDEEIFNSDAKDYVIGGVKFRLGSLDCRDTSVVDTFADRMLDVMFKLSASAGGQMVFCRLGYEERTYMLYACCGDAPKAAKSLAERAFGPSLREGIVYCERRLSRKLDVVPMLTRALAD